MRGRHAIQWAAIAVLLLLPMISRGSALFQAYGRGARNVDALAGPWESFLYSSFSWLLGGFRDPSAVADLFQGGYWSITLFGFTLSDPLAFLGHVAATGALHWPLVAGALAPLALAAVAGRFFCGWICPVNTILEANGKLRRWLERRVVRFRLPGFRLPPGFRTLILTAGIVFSAVAGFNAFAFLLPYAALARDWHMAVFGAGFGFGILFLVILLAVELLFAPRLWCRSLCPTGLVLETLGRRRAVGVRRASSEACPSGCRLCINVCPVAVNPRDQLGLERCLMCNDCVAGCPEQYLEISARKSRRKVPALAAALGAALVVTLFATSAWSHHIKGLPHYGYLENYPQIPTRELFMEAAPYEITLVAYLLEDINVDRAAMPGEAMIYVSVFNRTTLKPYEGDLRISLAAAGGGDTVAEDFSEPLEETVYQMRASLPAAAYDVEIFVGDALGAVGRARLEIAEPGPGALIWASIGVVLVSLAALYLVTWRRRKRSQAPSNV